MTRKKYTLNNQNLKLNQILFLIIILIGITSVTIIADVFLKKASLLPSYSGWQLLIVGAIIYAISAFGWFFAMRYIKLSTLGVIYSISTVIILTIISVYYFEEKISTAEIVGIFMAISSLVLLARFT